MSKANRNQRAVAGAPARAAAPINFPVARIKPSRQRKPRMAGTRNGFQVRHSELLFLATLDPTEILVDEAGFEVRQRAINPGLSGSFPWLGNVSERFETYDLESLRFEYRPRIGTGTPGSVIMYIDYDAKDPPPQTYVQAATMAGATSGTPYTPLSCSMSKGAASRGITRKYIRSEASGFSGDVSLYDTGTFFFCMSDPSATTSVTWGEVWAHYTVKLHTPQTTVIKSLTNGSETMYQTGDSMDIKGGVGTPQFSGGTPPVLDEAVLGPVDDLGNIVMRAGRWLVSQVADLTSDGTNSGHTFSSQLTVNGLPQATTFSQSMEDQIGAPYYSQAANEFILNFAGGDLLSSVGTAFAEGAGTFLPALLDRSLRLKFLSPLALTLSEVKSEQEKRAVVQRARMAAFITKHASKKQRTPPNYDDCSDQPSEKVPATPSKACAGCTQ